MTAHPIDTTRPPPPPREWPVHVFAIAFIAWALWMLVPKMCLLCNVNGGFDVQRELNP